MFALPFFIGCRVANHRCSTHRHRLRSYYFTNNNDYYTDSYDDDCSNLPYIQSPNKRRAAAKKKKPRGATRGKLTRRQEIDHVLVEETFPLFLPPHVAVRVDEDRHVGEGGYISTTLHNRRYYGVLIDQAALKAASMLYFQEAAAAQELHRKMLVLAKQEDHKRPSDTDWSDRAKRPRLDNVPDTTGSTSIPNRQLSLHSKIASASSPSSPSQVVQKYRWVAANDSAGEHRVLLASYMDVAAAAEDDPELHHAIDMACRSGGNFVGPYYYQYEVRKRLVHCCVHRMITHIVSSHTAQKLLAACQGGCHE